MSAEETNQGSGNQSGGKQQSGNQGAKQAGTRIPTFTVELGDECNRNFMLSTPRITQPPLRGRWSRTNLYNRPDGIKGALNPGPVVGAMPDIPGMCLEVKCHPPANPQKADTVGTVRIYDPLKNDPALLKELNRIGSSSDAVMLKSSSEEWVGREEVTHELTADEMKSLLLEISRMVYGKPPSARPLSGCEVPTEKELANFGGREIYDPWNSSNSKPKYKEDIQDWEDRQSRLRAMSR